MLRGTIAKPTVEQIVHLYGVDALCKALVPVIVREAEAALPAASATADNQKVGGAFAEGRNAVDTRPATSPGVTAGAAELVKAERERCAKIAINMNNGETAKAISAAIRKGGS
jgi:hypothetical protein